MIAESLLEPASQVWWWPWFLSMLLLTGPLVIGWLVGARFRERICLLPGLARLSVRVLVPAFLLGGGVLAVQQSPLVATWDIILGALAFGCALSAATFEGTGRLGRREWALLLMGSVAGLGLTEIVARNLLPPAPVQGAAHELTVTFAPEGREGACHLLYPDRYPEAIPPGVRDGATDHRVLHLGDSMVYGTSVAPEQSLVSLLARSDAHIAHINGAWPGTGTDHQSVLAEVLLALKPVDHVILYLNAANDLADLDKPYACCGHGPLLDQAHPEPAWRCPSPDWAFPVSALLARSPAPYSLRVLATLSRAAAYAARGFSRVVAHAEPTLGEPGDEEPARASWRRLTAMLRRLQATAQTRGARLTVVVLPSRGALEAYRTGDTALRTVHAGLVQAPKDVGLAVLDAWEVLSGALESQTPDTRVFSDAGGWDEHLAPHGHRVVASWLRDKLKP